MRAILWPRLSSHADCLPGVLRDPPRQQGEEGKEGHRGSQVTITILFIVEHLAQYNQYNQFALVHWSCLDLLEGAACIRLTEKCSLVQSSTKYFFRDRFVFARRSTVLYLFSGAVQSAESKKQGCAFVLWQRRGCSLDLSCSLDSPPAVKTLSHQLHCCSSTDLHCKAVQL